MGKLMQYFTGAAQPSGEEQLLAAQKAARGYSAKQEASARAAGFKSADQQMVYLKQKQTKTGGSVRGGGNFGMESLVPSWHPRTTLNKATEAMQNARER